MELNLHLDENGRTTYNPSCDVVPDGSDVINHNDEHPSKRARTTDSKQETQLDYSSRTTMTNLHRESEEAIDPLLFDCEVSYTLLILCPRIHMIILRMLSSFRSCV